MTLSYELLLVFSLKLNKRNEACVNCIAEKILDE